MGKGFRVCIKPYLTYTERKLNAEIFGCAAAQEKHINKERSVNLWTTSNRDLMVGENQDVTCHLGAEELT